MCNSEQQLVVYCWCIWIDWILIQLACVTYTNTWHALSLSLYYAFAEDSVSIQNQHPQTKESKSFAFVWTRIDLNNETQMKHINLLWFFCFIILAVKLFFAALSNTINTFNAWLETLQLTSYYVYYLYKWLCNSPNNYNYNKCNARCINNIFLAIRVSLLYYYFGLIEFALRLHLLRHWSR